jgi:ribosomal protein S18 acetylase RimI-like enzyme
METMTIRFAADEDRDGIWAVLEPMIRAGDTYTLPRDLSREQALAYWFSQGHQVSVAVDEEGFVLGTYYLRANQRGGGSHVANCGFVVAPWAAGQGVARRMAEHALALAKECGFRAMQFNFVVSTNVRAVGLWESLGFATLAVLPEVFEHPSLGFVDALIMFKKL